MLSQNLNNVNNFQKTAIPILKCIGFAGQFHMNFPHSNKVNLEKEGWEQILLYVSPASFNSLSCISNSSQKDEGMM